MANGKIITQTDNGRVIRIGGRGFYLIHMYADGTKEYRDRKNQALELFRKLDMTAQARYIKRVTAQRLQQDEYGGW